MNIELTGSQVVAIVYDNGVRKSAHWFRLPRCDEPRHYQTIGSFNCFRARENKRLVDSLAKTGTEKLARRSALSYEFEAAADWTEGLPQHRHQTLWDFYNAIGYDHKKQRYTDQD